LLIINGVQNVVLTKTEKIQKRSLEELITHQYGANIFSGNFCQIFG